MRRGLRERIKNSRFKICSARVRKEMVCSISERFSEIVSGSDCLHFLNGAQERLLETGATILLQRFFRDEQCEDFTLGDLHRGNAFTSSVYR